MGDEGKTHAVEQAAQGARLPTWYPVFGPRQLHLTCRNAAMYDSEDHSTLKHGASFCGDVPEAGTAAPDVAGARK